MVRLRLKELLKEHNMTSYALCKQLGMSYQNYKRMEDNKTKSIRYEMIETLCLIFNCKPGDLFDYNL